MSVACLTRTGRPAVPGAARVDDGRMSAAPRITLLTGAGISTGAGIPDFRGPQGLWTLDPAAEKTSTISWYLQDQHVRELSWQIRASTNIWAARPTAAHCAITELEKQGHVVGVITQNTDGLQQQAGTSPGLVHEVHGTERAVRCQDCGRVNSSDPIFTRVRAGDLQDFRCDVCGGILRPDVIMFEEMLDPEVMDKAQRAAENCDVMIAVGTTLSVVPAANFFPLALSAGAAGYIVNAEPTPYDDVADDVLRGDIQVELPLLLDRLLAAHRA